MKKRILSIFLILMILFINLSYMNIKYSYAQSLVESIGADFGFLSGAGTQLGSSFPTVFPGALYNQVDNYISGEGKKYAEQQYNNLSDSDKTFYQNVDKYYTFNKFECDSTAMTNSWNKDVDALKEFSKPYLQTLNNYYQNVSNQVVQMKNQLNMTVSNGVSSAGQTIDELINSFKNTKTRFQTDTDFLNLSYDAYKSTNKTLSDIYSLYKPLADKNYQNMTYGNLYYSVSTEAQRAKFLYDISDQVSSYFTNSDATSGFNIPYHLPVTFVLMPNYYENKDFKELNRVIMDYFDGDRFFFYQCKYTTNVSELISKGKLGAGALSTNAYCNDTLYYVSGKAYNLNFQKTKYSGYCYVPASLVSTTVTLPFNSLQDISEYRKNYLACIYPKINRPVNYVMKIDSLMSRKYSDVQPLTKELLASIPSIPNINVSTLPLADAGALPTNQDVEKQKELAGIPGVIPNTDIGTVPGTVPGTQPGTNQGINIDLNGFLTNLIEKLKELLKSLIIPDEKVFEDSFNKIKSKLPDSINPAYYRDFFLKERDSLSTHYFEDYYIDILDQHIKVVDMKYFREMLPKLKKYIDFFFWLLLIFYNYNELYFLIRGVKPLQSSSAKTVNITNNIYK